MKTLAQWLFRCLITAARLSYGVEGINALLLFMPSKLIVPTLRKYGAIIGEGVVIHSPLIIHNANPDYRNLVIGEHCYLGRAVFLDLKEKIILGERVTVSMRVTFITHTDAGESKISKLLPPSSAEIRIDSDAYIGASATILQGIKIGEKAIVGAASLVRKDVAANGVVAGNPAQSIHS